MTKSDSIINISKALALFHVKIEKVKKDATNPFFKSKYASLSNILEAINIPLAETGLVYTQHPSGANDLITILIHADSGEFFESCYNMPVAKQNDPQAVGSSITYARRYALGAILGLNIDDDDDANKGANKTIEGAESGKKEEVEKIWLNPNTELWAAAVANLKSGTVTIEQIKKKYAISKVNQVLLTNETK